MIVENQHRPMNLLSAPNITLQMRPSEGPRKGHIGPFNTLRSIVGHDFHRGLAYLKELRINLRDHAEIIHSANMPQPPLQTPKDPSVKDVPKLFFKK